MKWAVQDSSEAYQRDNNQIEWKRHGWHITALMGTTGHLSAWLENPMQLLERFVHSKDTRRQAP